MRLFTTFLFALAALSCRSQVATRSMPGDAAPGISSEISRTAILSTMTKVADWQLAHPSPTLGKYKENSWTYAAFYTGVMALSDIAGTPKYHNAMVQMGRKFRWQPPPRIYHADDQCVCQTYLELYLKDHDAAMIGPTRERLDHILAHPSTNDLHFKSPGATDRWSWCDALFMAPPAWARLYEATGDKKYFDFMDREWWATSDFLYDSNEHLFFRDSTYFSKHEANGKKVFWGRGNGWVLAGLARVMEVMPPDYPDRKRFEQQFKDMSERIAGLQQPDGLWRSSLLDPASYPLKETSGSGFYTFALAWGINHGLLDRKTYEPVVRKGWQALVECVTPEGKLEHVQPVGADPKAFLPTDTEVYGPGALLLAGREMYALVGAGAQK
jgi:unsaturated rhamnogalacturonyl hydrolase